MPPPFVRHEDTDEDSFSNPEKFLDQDYQQLLQECLSRDQLFTDEKFPADSRSIGRVHEATFDLNRVEWKRPKDLSANPQLVVDGMSRFDYKQGELGNCWFLAAVGALTFGKEIIKRVIPDEQSFSRNYKGIFHFRFWRFGRWVDVVIDDRLPTFNNNLIFVHSKTSNEFWPALLEKAYAKVCGSYADLDGGRISEALMDFTGGVHMHFQLNQAPPNLWETMYRAANSNALMGCGTNATRQSKEFKLPNGLVEGHAYSVTGAAEVMSGGNPVQLVRVLNPWGGNEWNGNWSDESHLWETVSEEDRQRHHQVFENGEFWMSMKDFTENFADMDICCLSPNFLERSPSRHWTSQRHSGKWVSGSTAGGCSNYTETFHTNPQFRVRIGELVGDDDGEGADNLLVSLIQNHEKKNRSDQQNYSIGFSVFKMEGDSKRCSAEFFKRAEALEQVTFSNLREVMKFFRLDPGEYVIVPSTFYQNEEASFVLSIFSKNETQFEFLEFIQETLENLAGGGLNADHSEGEELNPEYSEGEELNPEYSEGGELNPEYSEGEELNPEEEEFDRHIQIVEEAFVEHVLNEEDEDGSW